jgi:hypothetical protein
MIPGSARFSEMYWSPLSLVKITEELPGSKIIAAPI